jgi:hypothetical protein
MKEENIIFRTLVFKVLKGSSILKMYKLLFLKYILQEYLCVKNGIKSDGVYCKVRRP